jgi:hypothetical protein
MKVIAPLFVFALFTLLSFPAIADVENCLGGLRVGIDTIQKAKVLFGNNFYKYAEPPADLATYVWFDKDSGLLLHIQLATIDLKKDGIINTIKLANEVPALALSSIKSLSREKYFSKVELSKIKTNRGIKIGDNIEKVLSVYGPPFSHMDHSTHNFIDPDLYIFRYGDPEKKQEGVFTVTTSKSSKVVVQLEVHYVDW